jgi:hypothetical protein
MAVAARLIMAMKLAPVLQARMAMRLNLINFWKKFSIGCRHLIDLGVVFGWRFSSRASWDYGLHATANPSMRSKAPPRQTAAHRRQPVQDRMLCQGNAAQSVPIGYRSVLCESWLLSPFTALNQKTLKSGIPSRNKRRQA